jgi:hypothetical protein
MRDLGKSSQVLKCSERLEKKFESDKQGPKNLETFPSFEITKQDLKAIKKIQGLMEIYSRT